MAWRRNLGSRDIEVALALLERKLKLSRGKLTDGSVSLAERVQRARMISQVRVRQLHAEARAACEQEQLRQRAEVASLVAPSRRPGMHRTRIRERRSPAARRTSTSRDDGSDSHGDPDPLPPAALLGWPLANFVLLNADLGGPERLAKFMKQPGSVQSAAWAGLRDAIERRRVSEGVVA